MWGFQIPSLRLSYVALGILYLTVFQVAVLALSEQDDNGPLYLRRQLLEAQSDSPGWGSYAPEEDEAQAPVIVTLVTSHTDLSQLCSTFKTMDHFHGDNGESPLIIFDVLPLTEGQFEALQHCVTSDRFVSKVVLPSSEEEKRNRRRLQDSEDDWEMTETVFWTRQIWTQPSIFPYDVIVKVTDEACFTLDSSYLPDFSGPDLLYHGEYMDRLVDGLPEEHSVVDLYELAKEFIIEHQITPAHSGLWSTVEATMAKRKTLPAFSIEAFEIISSKLVEKPLVAEWHESIAEGLLAGKRFQLPTIRFITIAMFVAPAYLDVRPVLGFIAKSVGPNHSGPSHGSLCSVADYLAPK